MTQYKKLFAYAAKENINTIIIAGDIAPKSGPGDMFIQTQRIFYQQELQELFKNFTGDILFILGNDDAKSNLPHIERLCEATHAQYIHNKRIALEHFDVVGYSYVPITPFGIKDWEKWDTNKATQPSMNLFGVRSVADNWQEFDMHDEDGTIQEDLKNETFTKNAKHTLYVMHGPPKDTCLDQIGDGTHVGSQAIKDFIENEQPLATFHGHIHETVDVSGSYKETIGETHSYSPGNHNTTETIAIILFDPETPGKAERKIL